MKNSDADKFLSNLTSLWAQVAAYERAVAWANKMSYWNGNDIKISWLNGVGVKGYADVSNMLTSFVQNNWKPMLKDELQKKRNAIYYTADMVEIPPDAMKGFLSPIPSWLGEN